MENCKNCEHKIQEGDKFCSNCGQKTIDRLRVKTLLGELASAFLSWDSKLFRTLRLLLFKPGQVSKNYVEGKRKGYVAPMRIYLFFSVAFFVTLTLLGTSNSNITTDGSDGQTQNFSFNFGQDTMSMNRDSLLILAEHGMLDEVPLIKAQEEPFSKYMFKQLILMDLHKGGFRKVFMQNISYMFFFFIPVFAWILKLFYRRKQLDYIEHLVFGLYFHSFIFCIMLISLLLGRAFNLPWLVLVAFAGVLVYYIAGVKRFYETSLGNALWKFVLIGLIYLIIFTIFAILTIAITILAYNG